MDGLNWTQTKRNAFSAISRGELKTLINMIEDCPKLLNAFDTSGYSLLHVAAEQNNKDILEFLLNKGLDVNISRKNDNGHVTPLHRAVNKNLIENVTWLLNHGAKIDAGIGIHATPLIEAAFNGSLEMIELLVKSGANINAYYYVGDGKTRMKVTALVAAEMEGHDKIAVYLRNQDISEDNQNEDNESELKSKHDEIQNHVEMVFGKVTNTLSEIVPGSNVAINLNVIESSNDTDFITVFTTGMSDIPMDDSIEAYEERFAELIIKLPSNWPIKKKDINDMNNYWPLGWIRKIAHIPHMYDGWIGEGIIIPNGEPPKPFSENTNLSCMMICKPNGNILDRLIDSSGNIINFYVLIPVYKEERDMALKNGYKYLMQKMVDEGITDVIDIKRKNVAYS
ncbi:hypothetical protein J2Z44_001690 [Clostridium punense]|uniref:Suppressor of fused-like domain-containing protein n=1 Tax=Clostridium punense TaxID=1054297 RepID=A0ABS4K287_9CLOT|nr:MULTISPECIES: suppressor of fused domain protein [Clostridium]EQB89804.1 hypothetical protein M918_18795 [Clostridium sp. BL8]MBP2021894.1 hypothetical protein [Clostridium punense]